MDQNRWQKIEQLYHSALERPLDQRQAFLAEQCGDDEDLQREIESLLRNDDRPDDLIDRPAWDRAGTLLETLPGELPPGAPLGPYRIERLLGAGGMGTVYQARDSRLGRAVAIKVSAREFSGRFEREARAIASLAHPNICTLFDVGPNYLVMELLEGETLAERLRQGPLRLGDALLYACQIADAVANAHARGIVHRDLKPGNIMLVKNGVKVLDFGLAKIHSPGETITRTNAVLGTPAYMAPEQRQGREADARTDIYAIGLLLYEMAAGKRPAPGQPLAMPGLPSHTHIVQRCLAEDPEERWQTASDLKRELEWAASLPPTAEIANARKYPSRWTAILAVGLLAIGLGVGIGVTRFMTPHVGSRPIYVSINAPPRAELQPGPSISPDGNHIAFAASAGRESLWIRTLSSPAARELPGTEGAVFPFWSPDSRSVGFVASGKLKRVDIESGMSSVICGVGRGRGGTWGIDGSILFNSVNDGPLLRVSAAGGEPVPLTRLDAGREENSHRWPYFLPDGRRFLYFIRSANRQIEGVYLGTLDRPQERTQLLRISSSAIYAPSSDGKSGYVVWVKDGALISQRLDSRETHLEGEPVTLTDGVNFDNIGSLSDVSAGRQSRLVYRNGAGSIFQMTWYDRKGQPTGTVGPADLYAYLRFSPESSRILVGRRGSVDRRPGLALLELSQAIPRPLNAPLSGVLSPNGRQLAYGWSISGAPNIYTIDVDGGTTPERLTQSGNSQSIADWSRDGRFLLYSELPNDAASGTRSDLWALSLTDRKPLRLMMTPSDETHGQFSPDSKWVAYTSDEPGRPEIFLQSFPTTGPKWQISHNGGDYARWSRDGKELFYIAPDGNLMALDIRLVAGRPALGKPSVLFKMPGSPRVAFVADAPYDIAPNGRILALAPAAETAVSSLSVVFGWETLVNGPK